MRKTIAHAILTGTMMLACFGAAPAQASPIYVKGHGLGVDSLEIMAPVYFRSFAGQVAPRHRSSRHASDDFYGCCVDATRSRDMAQDMTIRPLSELPDHGNPVGGRFRPDAGARIAWLINTYCERRLVRDGRQQQGGGPPVGGLGGALHAVRQLRHRRRATSGSSTAALYPSLVSYSEPYFSAMGSNDGPRPSGMTTPTASLSTGQDFR